GHALREPRHPGARRLRVHERVPCRALLARRAHLRDLRRHDGSPENGSRSSGAEGARARRLALLGAHESVAVRIRKPAKEPRRNESMKRPIRPVALVILTLCALYPGLTSVFQ